MLGSLWHDSRLMNVVAGLFSLIALVLLLAAGIAWVAHRPMFSLKVVRVDGDLTHINASAVRANAIPRLKGNFFTMDLESARAAFETVPWVRKASVRRVWPNGLLVELQEHHAVAQWGETKLLNDHGEVFIANMAEAEEEGELPVLYGPVGSESLVLTRFNSIKEWLSKLNQTPVDIRLSDRFAWSVVLSSGLRLELGREQTPSTLQERVTLYLKSYPVVMNQLMKSLQVFDLRYPNGFALKGDSLQQPKGIMVSGTSGVAVR